MTSREASDLGCHREAVKWLKNKILSSAHEWMELGKRFMYHVMVPILKVIGKI